MGSSWLILIFRVIACLYPLFLVASDVRPLDEEIQRTSILIQGGQYREAENRCRSLLESCRSKRLVGPAPR